MNNITPNNQPKKVAIATMMGTTIEYFDNYIYAMAAVLVFSEQFFDGSDALASQIAALYTFALNLLARPLGAVLFGHYGDTLGRKNTLVISLLLMGFCTVAIGLLPTYASIGVWASILLFLCRTLQGIGLGGEWGGAALVALENAPSHQRGLFTAFMQLGAAIGLFLANLVFWALAAYFGKQAFTDWAWRLPFIASACLVMIGLYVRLNLQESAIFTHAKQQGRLHALPIKAVLTVHKVPFAKAILIAIIGYVQFYMVAIFGQIYAKTSSQPSAFGHAQGLGLPAWDFTEALLFGALVFAVSIVLSGYWCDKFGRKTVLIISTGLIGVFGLNLPLFLSDGGLVYEATGLYGFVGVGMFLLGANFGPMAVILPELFATQVRYIGASLSFTLAGILGASVATIVAIKLNAQFGLFGVGVYVFANALLSLIGLGLVAETQKDELV
ncbi:MFS transporter [Moraxella sp.]|uniref:MFS transporter n=1 Tax=Moraxella sp. TaxID=479 RepID=UPI0026DD9DF2|nr:MFS transporter [Moraxella sp.]MDO4895414.1 MFS transporter [Moraxella sp.]